MSWRHLEDTTPKARKPHQCELCGRAINAGERYVRRSGVQDDELYSFPMHTTCEEKTRDWTAWDWDDFGGDCTEFRRSFLGEELEEGR